MKNTENMDINHAEPVERIDWYSQGESCSLRIGETTLVIRLVDRKGRRARISVSATQGGEAGRLLEDVGGSKK